MAIVTFDAREWKDLVKTIDKNVKDPKPMLRAAFATRGFRDVIEHFQREEGQSGKWSSLAPSTVAKRGPGAKPLQDTGNLRQNFSPSNIEDRGTDEIVFFNPTPYASYHDNGTSRIPRREFMWLSAKSQEEMLKIILDLVVKE